MEIEGKEEEKTGGKREKERERWREIEIEKVMERIKESREVQKYKE